MDFFLLSAGYESDQVPEGCAFAFVFEMQEGRRKFV